MQPYTLIRSRRRTLALTINAQGGLEARAPLYMPRSEIDAFVTAKEDWIARHLVRSSERIPLGEQTTLPYLGQEYPIVWNAPQTGFDGEVFALHSDNPEFLRILYKQLAFRYLPRRTASLAQAMGFPACRVRINTARRQWGSCNGQNVLSFSAHLMCAPADTIDYVILHELCHIVHRNHSERFWALVSRHIPDYPRHRAVLKDLQTATSWWNDGD